MKTAVAQFTALNPRIRIELVPLASAQPTLAELASLDAVGTAPTADLLAAGAVRDLTPMMQTDTDFDRADFYEQQWQEAWWRERMWFMPLAGRMNVIYYDKNGYRDANQPEPTLRWTWQEMEADMTAVSLGTNSPNGALEWGFLDVESPLLYELRFQLNPLGVLPFPDSNRFDGITPLWVAGAFMTVGTERPYTTWQWLKFLTYQPLSARFRLVPARPSVATSSQFWGRLPHDLGNAMRTAFPFSRPVLLEEQHFFSWKMLTAVQNEVAPETAVQLRPRLVWFRQ